LLIRALKACPERSEGRRLGEGANSKELDAFYNVRAIT